MKQIIILIIALMLTSCYTTMTTREEGTQNNKETLWIAVPFTFLSGAIAWDSFATATDHTKVNTADADHAATRHYIIGTAATFSAIGGIIYVANTTSK